jgi:hypothetical protein
MGRMMRSAVLFLAAMIPKGIPNEEGNHGRDDHQRGGLHRLSPVAHEVISCRKPESTKGQVRPLHFIPPLSSKICGRFGNSLPARTTNSINNHKGVPSSRSLMWLTCPQITTSIARQRTESYPPGHQSRSHIYFLNQLLFSYVRFNIQVFVSRV